MDKALILLLSSIFFLTIVITAFLLLTKRGDFILKGSQNKTIIAESKKLEDMDISNDKGLNKGYFDKFETEGNLEYVIFIDQNKTQRRLPLLKTTKLTDFKTDLQKNYFKKGDVLVIRVVKLGSDIEYAEIIINYTRH